MRAFDTPAHRRAKAIIAAAAEAGAGIDFIPDAPTFRFEPVTDRPLHNGPPSKRGGFTYPNPLKLKNWTPTRLSFEPQYNVAMAGDSYALTDARKAWARGNPDPLRQWLEAEAEVRRGIWPDGPRRRYAA